MRAELLLNYKFTATWLRGKDHVVADTLSRAPVTAEDELAVQEVEFHLRSLTSTRRRVVVEDYHLTELRPVMEGDSEYQELLQAIQVGFPQDKGRLPLLIRPYWPVRDRLTVEDGFILCGCHLVIPKALRKTMLAIKAWRGPRGGHVLPSIGLGLTMILN